MARAAAEPGTPTPNNSATHLHPAPVPNSDPTSLLLLSQLNSVILVVGAVLCFGEWGGYDGAAAYISAYGDWSHPVTFASLFVGYTTGRVSDTQRTAQPCSSPRSYRDSTGTCSGTSAG